MSDRDVAGTFLRWTWTRAVFHRGYWLVTSLYLVAEADLSPFQLVFIGTAQGLTAIAFEVPTGVMADTVSRKWSVEVRIDGVGIAPRAYAAACFIGALGLVVLAAAPDEVTGMAGVLLVAGIGEPVTRTVSVIWVNRRTTSDVRATVQSFLAQAEYLGEISFGFALGVLAQATSISIAMIGSCALVTWAGVMAVRSRERGVARYNPDP